MSGPLTSLSGTSNPITSVAVARLEEALRASPFVVFLAPAGEHRSAVIDRVTEAFTIEGVLQIRFVAKGPPPMSAGAMPSYPGESGGLEDAISALNALHRQGKRLLLAIDAAERLKDKALGLLQGIHIFGDEVQPHGVSVLLVGEESLMQRILEGRYRDLAARMVVVREESVDRPSIQEAPAARHGPDLTGAAVSSGGGVMDKISARTGIIPMGPRGPGPAEAHPNTTRPNPTVRATQMGAGLHPKRQVPVLLRHPSQHPAPSSPSKWGDLAWPLLILLFALVGGAWYWYVNDPKMQEAWRDIRGQVFSSHPPTVPLAGPTAPLASHARMAPSAAASHRNAAGPLKAGRSGEPQPKPTSPP